MKLAIWIIPSSCLFKSSCQNSTICPIPNSHLWSLYLGQGWGRHQKGWLRQWPGVLVPRKQTRTCCRHRLRLWYNLHPETQSAPHRGSGESEVTWGPAAPQPLASRFLFCLAMKAEDPCPSGSQCQLLTDQLALPWAIQNHWKETKRDLLLLRPWASVWNCLTYCVTMLVC